MSLRTISQALSFGLVLGLAATAQAQATRTWVSGVGDDANPCSRTAPCKTFAGAISKTAAGGFISVLDPGGFGAVTITKSITIDGEGTHASVLAALVTGVTINGSGIKVTLRNLTLDSPLGSPGLDGVRVLLASEVHIEKCWIGGFSDNGIEFNPSGGGELYVSDTTVSNNTNHGVLVSQGRAMISGLRAESNAFGVRVNGSAIATVRDSYAALNGVGFGADTFSAAVINLDGVVSSHNGEGVKVESGATARLSNSMVVSNTVRGLFNSGGASFLVSLRGNTVFGNPTDGSFTSFVEKQ